MKKNSRLIALMMFLAVTVSLLTAWCPDAKMWDRWEVLLGGNRERSPVYQEYLKTKPTVTPGPTPTPTPTPVPPPIPTPSPTPTPTPNPVQNPTPAPVVITPPPTPQRLPNMGTGLSPLVFNIINPIPNWEVWWTRNRLYYLPFKEPIDWEPPKTPSGDNDVKNNNETIAVTAQSNKKIIDILANCLEDNNAAVKANAVLALAKFRDAKGVEYIKKSLSLTEKKYYDVRNVGILSLGIIGDPAYVKDIKDIIFNKDAYMITKAYGALALGYINDPSSIEALKEIYDPKNKMEKEVRCSALLSLGNSGAHYIGTGDQSLIQFFDKIISNQKEDAQIRSYAVLALGRLKNDDTLPTLKKVVADKQVNVRLSAVIALGYLKSPEAKQELQTILAKDRDSNVKGLAAIALAKLDDKSAVPILIASIKKGDFNLQGFSVLALGLLNSASVDKLDEKSKDELRTILVKKTKPFSRGASALALGMAKDKKSVPDLINIVEKEEVSDPVTWSYAILALGMIGDQQAVPVLEKVFEKVQTRPDLADTAYNNLTVSLAMLGQRSKVLEIFYKKLTDKTLAPDMKMKILHGIGYIGDKTSIEPLAEFYKTEKNNDLRAYAVLALGFVLDRDKINPLYKITADSNYNIRLAIMDHIYYSKPD
ncbi:MAG: HEAT repeat domain-containing protein [Planctomycetota bacterium]